MAKHTNKFIDQLQKGNKFYLAVFTRGYSDVWVGEVELQSKNMTADKQWVEEPRMQPCYVTDYYYTLKLKSEENNFSITIRDFGWNGDTNLESNNIKISGADLLMSGFWVADCYMTTDKDKFKKYISENNLLEKSIVALQKDKEVIEKKLKKLFSFYSSTIA